jgi:hypothetical protein
MSLIYWHAEPPAILKQSPNFDWSSLHLNAPELVAESVTGLPLILGDIVYLCLPTIVVLDTLASHSHTY